MSVYVLSFHLVSVSGTVSTSGTESATGAYGGLFEADDLLDEPVVNTKFVLIQAAAPATKYDGEVWVSTSSDPPLAQTYDGTNTRWQQQHSRYYRSLNQAYKTLSQPIQLHGGLSLQHDSGSGGDAYLYFYANGLWWGIRAQ